MSAKFCTCEHLIHVSTCLYVLIDLAQLCMITDLAHFCAFVGERGIWTNRMWHLETAPGPKSPCLWCTAFQSPYTRSRSSKLFYLVTGCTSNCSVRPEWATITYSIRAFPPLVSSQTGLRPTLPDVRAVIQLNMQGSGCSNTPLLQQCSTSQILVTSWSQDTNTLISK